MIVGQSQNYFWTSVKPTLDVLESCFGISTSRSEINDLDSFTLTIREHDILRLKVTMNHPYLP